MIKDSFRSDIEFLFERLKNKEKFSFSKYADGEFAILANQKITNVDNKTSLALTYHNLCLGVYFGLFFK